MVDVIQEWNSMILENNVPHMRGAKGHRIFSISEKERSH